MVLVQFGMGRVFEEAWEGTERVQEVVTVYRTSQVSFITCMPTV